jgi:hypothetical protein
MSCAPGLVFGGTKGVGSRFHVLRARTRFRRYRRRLVPFACFAHLNSFSAVSRASVPVFMFCAHGLIFGGTEGVGTRFHVLCFGLVFGGTVGVPSSFHVFRSRTHFRRCRVRRDPFSYFVLPDSFSAVPWASLPDFMFSAPRHVFSGTKGARTRFRRYQRRRVLFSCFAHPDSFSPVQRTSVPIFLFCVPGLVFSSSEGVDTVFMFCAPGLVFICNEVVGSPFHVLRSRTHFRRYRGSSGPVFIFCASGLIFGGIEGVRSLFHVFRSRTCFRWYRGHRVPFSCFPLSDMFSAVSRASSPFFMFCAPELVFGGTVGVGSRFHVLRSRTSFRRYRGVRSLFHVLHAQTLFRLYRVHRVPFSCFAHSDSFLAVQRASGPVFMFCAPGLVFGGTEGVRSHFHDLCSQIHFRRC